MEPTQGVGVHFWRQQTVHLDQWVPEYFEVFPELDYLSKWVEEAWEMLSHSSEE